MTKIPFGRRTIPSAIDQLALTFPTQPWAGYPSDDYDEIIYISYKACATTVDAASWWLRDTLGLSDSFQTIAYIGPHDIRYIILFCAAVKCGYKILFTSPRNSQEGHTQLFQATNCTTLLYGSTTDLRLLPQATPGLRLVQTPDLRDLLNVENENIPPFPYEKTFGEAEDDPCIVLHTSGTTSLPKPIVLTHGQLAVFDAQWMLPPFQGREVFLQAIASSPPFLVGLPFFNMAGFSMGAWLSLKPDVGVLFTSPTRPLSLVAIEQALDSTPVGGAIIPPSLLEEAVAVSADEDGSDDPTLLAKLARTPYIFYGGAPLSPEAGRAISSRTHLCNQIGSTECVILTTHMTDRADWDYFCFGSERSWYEFRPTESLPDMYEMIIVKDAHGKRDLQAVFRGSDCDITEFRTKDLYSPHPSKPHHWKYRGRLDDVIVLSHGEKLNPVAGEALIGSHPLLRSAMYIGSAGRPQPAVVLELAEEKVTQLDQESVVQAVWPLIERANAAAPAYGQLHRSHVLVTDPTKRFLRTTKETLRRLHTVELLEPEICALYENYNNETKDNIDASMKLTVCIDISKPDEMQDFVLAVYQKTTKTGHLRPNDDIFLAGADSLSIQGAIAALRNSLSASSGLPLNTSQINQRTVYAHPTAQSMTEFLEELVEGTDNTIPVSDEGGRLWEVYERYRRRLSSEECTSIAELTLPSSLPSSSSMSCALTTVLLTGSTGNLGSYILDALLARDDVAEVICLNRSHDAAERQLRSHAEKGLCIKALNKARFLHADLSQPRLGLSESNYTNLLSRTTVVIHNAWPVNFNLSLSSFEPHLEGVINLIKFSTIPSSSSSSSSNNRKLKPKLIFISSISEINNWRRQIHLESTSQCNLYTIPETQPSSSYTSREDLLLASGGYGQSKAISTLLLRHASSHHGLRDAVSVRLGQVAGPVRRGVKGVWTTSEWFPSLVQISYALDALPGSIPLLDEIDWVPVDDVAQIIVEVALGDCGNATPVTEEDEDEDKGENGKEEDDDLGSSVLRQVNIANPHTVPWAKLAPTVARARNDKPLEIVGFDEWLRRLETCAPASEKQQRDSDGVEDDNEQGEDEKVAAARIESLPALKLLDFFQDLEEGRRMGARQTLLRMGRLEPRLVASVGAIDESMMATWLAQWGLGGEDGLN